MEKTDIFVVLCHVLSTRWETGAKSGCWVQINKTVGPCVIFVCLYFSVLNGVNLGRCELETLYGLCHKSVTEFRRVFLWNLSFT